MTTNKILIAGLIGTAISFFLGSLIYGILMAEFFESTAGSATGVMKSDEEMDWATMIIGHMAWGIMLALIVGKWAGIKTFVSGAKAGAIIGFLFAMTHDMINLATTNMMTTTGALGDVAVSTVIGAATGGAIGWFFGRD